MKLKKYIGSKEFYKETIMIALPIMLQQFVTSFVNLIDNVMIGSVGSTALTSVTVANRFYLIFNSTLFGLCGAAGIFIAQYFGAKDHKNCQKVFDINIVCDVIIALFFMALALLIPKTILGLFTKTTAIMTLGLDYMDVIKYSYIPNAISFTIMMALRAVAINNVQLKVGLVTVATNTFLNYCLIYGHFGFPVLGVKGAAIATLIARIVELVIYTILIQSKKYFFTWHMKGLLHLNSKLFKKMFKKALPLTINEILFSVGMSMLFKSYMRVDEYLVAAITVVDTVVNIAFIIFGGLSSAVSIMIGKRLGANQLEEAKENAVKLIVFGAFVSAVIGLILFNVAPFIPKLYNLEVDINQTIVTLLRIKACLLPVYVINVCVFFTLRAGGDAKSTLMMDSGYLWGVSVVVSTGLSIFTGIGLIPLYVVVESLDIIKMAVCAYYFKKGTWVKNLTA